MAQKNVAPMKSLLEAGVHFGHRTRRWNPKMKQYIFTERNGIHIIDLQQTIGHLNKAYDIVKDTVASGGMTKAPVQLVMPPSMSFSDMVPLKLGESSI